MWGHHHPLSKPLSLLLLGLWLVAASLPLQAAEALQVLDVSERAIEGKNQICALFSQPLDPSTNIQPYFNLTTDQGLVKGAWVLSRDGRRACFPDTEPETDYRLTIYRKLQAANGSQLAQNHPASLKTRQLQPAASFDSQGSLLLPHKGSGLPIVAVNVEAVDITFHRVREASLLEVWRQLQSRYRYSLFEKLADWTELVHSGRFTLDLPRNTRARRSIDISAQPALAEPGLYLALMKPAGSYTSHPETAYFTITDIGLHARRYNNQLDIYSYSLGKAQPLASVTLEALDRKGNLIATSRTSPEGLASFSHALDQIELIRAHKEAQLTLLTLNRPALDLSDFGLGEQPDQAQQLFIYSERDLYRPGETIHFNGLLRDRDGRFDNAPVLKATIRGPDDQEVKRLRWRSDALAGYYQQAFHIPTSAKTGRWQLQVEKPDGEPARYSFQVEEFLPERMKLDLSAATDKSTSPAEPIEIKVQGDYLYGAPAAGNRLSSQLELALWRDPIATLPGFQFGDQDEQQHSQRFELEDLQLDASGQARLQIPSRWADSRSPLRLSLTASLFESGGRPVSRRHDQLIWPTGGVIGIRPPFDKEQNPPTDSRLTFEIVMADADGRLLAAQGLEATLIREERQYFWEYSSDRGWYSEFTEQAYPVLNTTLDLAEGEHGKLELPVEWGRYRLEISDPASGRRSSLRFTAGETWYHDWQQSQQSGQAARPDKVSLALDQAAYRPGDTAQLRIVPPHDGQGLVLVESSERPLWSASLPLRKAGSQIEIPIDPTWQRHDLYISVLALRPAATDQQLITPNRAIGLLHLPLERSERRLEVSIQSPDKVEPNRPLTVRLKAQGIDNSQPLHATLAAVDVGVLNITDFATPDPFAGLFQRRRFQVESRDVYGRLIELNRYPLARQRFGGDGMGGNAKMPRSEVKIISLFNGPVSLNAQGEAQIELKLPDFNGTLRLMAVAFGEDRFGSGEREIQVAAPVVTQLALPRFLASGDQSNLALDLHNTTDTEQSLSLQLQATAPLILNAEPERLLLAAGEKRTLRYPLQAGDRFGLAQIHLAVEGEQIEPFQRHWQLTVQPAWPAIRERRSLILEPGEHAPLPLPALSAFSPATVVARLSLDNSITLQIEDQVEALLRYPYGCLEQTTSSAWPWLHANEQNLRRFGLDPEQLNKRQQSLEQAFERLQAQQRGSGGFGLWDNHSPEEHWLTAYVADFLLSAQAMGLAVEPEFLRRVVERLEQYLKQSRMLIERHSDAPDHYRLAYRAYAGYVLSRINRANLGHLRSLWRSQAQYTRSGLPLIHLGLALKNQGDHKNGAAAITRGLEIGAPKPGAYLGDYGSPLRDQALMISLLADAKIHDKPVIGMTRTLRDQLLSRQYLSTQERNALFLAALALQRPDDNPWQVGLRIGEELLELVQSGAYQISLEIDQLSAGITLENRSDAPLISDLLLSGYPNQPPKPVSQGISVARSHYSRDGKPIDLKQIKTGELVLVHLQLDAEQRIPDALLVELLPAGLELENQNLKHAIQLDQIKIDNRPVSELMQQSQIVHREYRDDRFVAALNLRKGQSSHLFYLARAVTPGRYQVPPTLVEDMYRPELRAIGESGGLLEVLDAP